jgi:hypothetical protein
MKRRFVWAITIVVAVLGTACSDAQDAAGLLGPTATAANGETALTAARSGVRCGPGGVATRPDGTPPDARTGGPGDLGQAGSNGTVTSPGGAPSGTPSGAVRMGGPGGLGAAGSDGTILSPGANPTTPPVRGTCTVGD